jgi:hypothetical protein
MFRDSKDERERLHPNQDAKRLRYSAKPNGRS